MKKLIKKLEDIILGGELANYSYYLFEYFETLYNISIKVLNNELAKVWHGGSEIIEAGLTKEFHFIDLEFTI